MRFLPIILVALGLAGCAIPGPRSVHDGETQADVRARLGAPAVERKLASGDSAWYYVTGPSGFFTYRVVFGAGGSVTEYSQVLTRQNFMAQPPGASRDAVLDRFGPPLERMTFARTGTEIWTYRWLDGTFEMLADAVFDVHKGTLNDIVLRRDPVYESGVSPN